MTHFQFQQFFKICITSHCKARAELLVSNKVFKLNNWSLSSLANASPLYLKTQGYCLQNDALQLYFRLQDKNLLNIQSLLLLKLPISCKLIVSKGVQTIKLLTPSLQNSPVMANHRACQCPSVSNHTTRGLLYESPIFI